MRVVEPEQHRPGHRGATQDAAKGRPSPLRVASPEIGVGAPELGQQGDFGVVQGWVPAAADFVHPASRAVRVEV